MLTVDFSLLEICPGDRILDLGCGEGRHLHNLYLKKDILVYGLDKDMDALRVVERTCWEFARDNEKKNWLILQGDCEALPFRSECFHHVIASEVLEHIEDYHRVVKDLWRLLKKSGNLVISVPRYWPERLCWALSREYCLEKGGHIRIFKANALKLEVERIGFKCFKVHYAHALHSPYWWLKCLCWEKRETWLPVKIYHKFLVWDILKAPAFTKFLERLLNPIMGKSVVMYFKKVEK